MADQVHVQSQAPVSGPDGVAAAPGSISISMTSLYVGDLDVNVDDSQLYDLFSQIGQVVSVRVCTDLTTHRSLGYGYVNYSNPQDAERALDVLNFTPLNEKPIRIMYSRRDPSIRKSGAGNIFIKNLDKSVDNKALHDTFSSFGNILSCKVSTDASGQSKGYGFVQFEKQESAQSAIDQLNGMLINDKKVYVGHFLRKQERDATGNNTNFNNVYVKNLSESTTDEVLKQTFGEFGHITSAVVMKDGDGKSRGFGFVNFENADAAAKAVEALNGKKFDDKEWYVARAQKKSEREQELRGKFEQSTKEAADKYQGGNLYVKNLDDSIDEEKLKEMFAEYGRITSCKVMRDPSGISKGSGFVAFSSVEEASRALAGMNGKMIFNKPLYVAIAQRKEERRARLQAQFSQMRPVMLAHSGAPRPLFTPGAPGLGQQLFYGQAPRVLPPQGGFGYQQQLVRGMRPGNFLVPMGRTGQGQRPWGRHGAGPAQKSQPPISVMQQQVGMSHSFRSSVSTSRVGVSSATTSLSLGTGVPMGHVYRYPPRRNNPNAPILGGGGGVFPFYGMGAMPARYPLLGPMSIPTLARALSTAPPDQHRTMLGETLYPLVEGIEHDNAAKVTGMLLELDQTEILRLLESPEALEAKVAEAVEVLRNVAQQQQANGTADQLASLSLNDKLAS